MAAALLSGQELLHTKAVVMRMWASAPLGKASMASGQEQAELGWAVPLLAWVVRR